MIKTPLDLAAVLPFSRDKATAIAREASRYECVITLQDPSVIINLKSMIGLLSMAIKGTAPIMLVCDGTDEEQAAQAVSALIESMK